MNLEINQRNYPLKFNKPVVVICLDGSQKEYLDRASESKLTPNLDKIINEGEFILAHSAIPSFTNPNNISIVTGQPSAVHGICGNFFYTPSTGEEVMMNDPKFLRAPTIFQKYYESGAKIAIVTAKDKLRKLLSHGLAFNDARAICFSSEKSDQVSLNENGIEEVNKWLGMEVPEVYSQGLSEFVMAAGVKLLHEFKPDIVVNLAAQAGVRYSIENPSAYVSSNIMGFTSVLEASKKNNVKHLVYASTSSVYGLSKLISYEIVKFFREKFNLRVCSGIMFHHESALRQKDFVLKKIIRGVKNIKINNPPNNNPKLNIEAVI